MSAESLHEILEIIVNYGVFLFESAGVIVLLISGIQGIINYIKHAPTTRSKLAQGMAMGLEFKLGSEILRTVTVRTFSECALVAFIILLRASLTFLLHWEIRQEEEKKEA